MKRHNATWQRAMYLTSRPNFKKDIKAIREANSIPLLGFPSENAYEEWAEKHIYKTTEGNAREETIDAAVADILSNPEYALSPGWHHSIKRFLYFNEVDAMELPSRLDVSVETDKVTKQTMMHIIVGEETTEDEYREGWHNVEYLRRFYGLKAPTKERQADNFTLRRKKLAYDVWSETHSYVEAAKAVEKRFAREYAHEVYDAESAKTDVRNFIKQAGI